MTNNEKKVLKNIILGLLGGSAVASLYSMYQARKLTNDADGESSENKKNKITVPLSKEHFMKSVGKGADKDQRLIGNKEVLALPDYSSMTPADLAAYKRQLLKGASASKKENNQVKVNKTKPVTLTSDVKVNSGKVKASFRGDHGHFASAKSLSKEAQMSNSDARYWSDLGLVGGALTGVMLTKKIMDRIMINKAERRVEDSKKEYARMVNRNIDKYAQAEDTPESFLEKYIGRGRAIGLGTSILTGLVAYQLMENRRKAKMKESNKDDSRYPAEKTINFKMV